MPVTPSIGASRSPTNWATSPQGAAGNDNRQVEGAAHEVHALHFVILVDTLRDTVKTADSLWGDLDPRLEP